MININDLLQQLKADVNPSQGGHIRPSQNFIRWVIAVQEEIFEELARQWEKNSTISDKLTPFLKSINVTLTPQPGKPYDTFMLPQTYRYWSSARFLRPAGAGTGAGVKGCEIVDGSTGQQRRYVDEDEVALNLVASGTGGVEIPITKVDNQRWGSAMKHRTKGPSFDNPILTKYDEGCKVAPRGLGVIVLDYLRPPVKPVFNFTVNSDDIEVFNPTGSVHLEWDSNMIPEFLARLAIKYAVYTKDESVYQAGQTQRSQTKS